jgi:multidrug transporter EmrE-like cation transporter
VNTPLNSILLVLLASFIGSFGAVFLKGGSSRLSSSSIFSLLLNWRLAVGILLFVLSSVFFILAIKRGELSVLYPMVSLSYVWTMLWSRLFFGEPFTKGKFIGLGMILVGICFLGFGTSRH